MSLSIQFLQSQIVPATHITSLKTLGRNTEDGLEQTKVLAPVLKWIIRRQRRNYGDIDMSFLTTYRATPQGQHFERRLNQLNWF